VLGKFRGFGVSVAWGDGAAVPLPVMVAVWGDPLALSATEMLAVSPVVAVAGMKDAIGFTSHLWKCTAWPG
jgi:hypothetical protein